MFAIAFDLVVKDADTHHPKGVTQAYVDVGNLLQKHGYIRRQGSVYTSDDEDLTKLVLVMNALKALPWFSKVVRDIRAFRVEQWSDFTSMMKGP